jgi:hypothetical protein
MFLLYLLIMFFFAFRYSITENMFIHVIYICIVGKLPVETPRRAPELQEQSSEGEGENESLENESVESGSTSEEEEAGAAAARPG